MLLALCGCPSSSQSPPQQAGGSTPAPALLATPAGHGPATPAGSSGTATPAGSVSTATPAAVATKAAPPDLVFPAPLMYADGKPLQEAPAITPFDGVTDAGEFKLGLFSSQSPEHVKALIPHMGVAFTGTSIRSVAGQGLVLEAKNGTKALPALKPEGQPMKLANGGLYLNAKEKKLLIVQDAKKLPPNWHFVGQAILSKSLLEATAKKKAPRISKLEGLSI